MNTKDISTYIKEKSISNFTFNSRIHQLNGLRSANGKKIFIKRDDELSSGIVGSKFRKYSSLIKYILDEQKFIVFIGSANSNNILGLAQLLTENNINFGICIKEANSNTIGNFSWLRQIVNEDKLLVLKKGVWQNRNTIIQQKFGTSIEIIEEGAVHEAAIPSLLSLATEIEEFEVKNNLFFDTIFMDAGTGFTAAVTIACLSRTNTKRKYHICLIAGSEEEFKIQLDKAYNFLFQEHLIQVKNYADLQFHFPISGKSYGSINATVKKYWKKIMQTEGIIMDPTYSVKHYMTVSNLLKSNFHLKNGLFIYSGGSFAAQNYQSLL